MLEVGKESTRTGLRKRTQEAGGPPGQWADIRFKKEQCGKCQTLPRARERSAEKGPRVGKSLVPGDLGEGSVEGWTGQRSGGVRLSYCCVTDHHKLSDLNSTTLFSSSSSGPKSKISLTGLKSRCQRAGSLRRLQGRTHLLASSASRGRLYSLACGPFLHLQRASL